MPKPLNIAHILTKDLAQAAKATPQEFNDYLTKVNDKIPKEGSDQLDDYAKKTGLAITLITMEECEFLDHLKTPETLGSLLTITNTIFLNTYGRGKDLGDFDNIQHDLRTCITLCETCDPKALSPNTLRTLGEVYEHGTAGVQKDPAKAEQYYQYSLEKVAKNHELSPTPKSAQALANAQYHLATFYGQQKVPGTMDMAKPQEYQQLLSQAAQSGHPDANLTMGLESARQQNAAGQSQALAYFKVASDRGQIYDPYHKKEGRDARANLIAYSIAEEVYKKPFDECSKGEQQAIDTVLTGDKKTSNAYDAAIKNPAKTENFIKEQTAKLQEKSEAKDQSKSTPGHNGASNQSLTQEEAKEQSSGEKTISQNKDKLNSTSVDSQPTQAQQGPDKKGFTR